MLEHVSFSIRLFNNKRPCASSNGEEQMESLKHSQLPKVKEGNIAICVMIMSFIHIPNNNNKFIVNQNLKQFFYKF